jgi:hypothetical protein
LLVNIVSHPAAPVQSPNPLLHVKPHTPFVHVRVLFGNVGQSAGTTHSGGAPPTPPIPPTPAIPPPPAIPPIPPAPAIPAIPPTLELLLDDDSPVPPDPPSPQYVASSQPITWRHPYEPTNNQPAAKPHFVIVRISKLHSGDCSAIPRGHHGNDLTLFRARFFLMYPSAQEKQTHTEPHQRSTCQ